MTAFTFTNEDVYYLADELEASAKHYPDVCVPMIFLAQQLKALCPLIESIEQYVTDETDDACDPLEVMRALEKLRSC